MKLNIKIMNKVTLLLFCTFITICSVAQKHNVTSAAITFKQFKGDNTEKLEEAKNFIDQAYNTESTSNDPKMWNYRSQIYLKIATTKDQLIDKDAVFKATEAYLKCIQTDQKGRVVVRKWTTEEDVRNNLINCGLLLNNLAIKMISDKDFNSALVCYGRISEIIPYDTEDQFKRGNITKETLLYSKFFAHYHLNDNNKSKEVLQQLIDLNFNEPKIYKYMSDIYIKEDKPDKALEYLSLGREMFEDDELLIIEEINLYIKLDRTSELITKLGEAILLDEENDKLYFSRGAIYDQQGNIEMAEKDYLLAIDLNPSSFSATYNLGALYFNYGVKLKDEAGNASNNTKYTALKKQADANFAKALPYMEVAFNLNGEDKNTIISLKQLYALKGDYDKSNQMKKLLAELK